jgi:hypothetical protein
MAYSTRFASFSVMFMALTRAAARSGGDAFMSHTVLLASGPLTQSGYWKPMPSLAARAAARTHVEGDNGFIVTKYKKTKSRSSSNHVLHRIRYNMKGRQTGEFMICYMPFNVRRQYPLSISTSME